MSTLRTLGVVSATLAGVALGLSVVNTLSWPRGRQRGWPPRAHAGRVSVLIPARNEEEEIATCVSAIFRGTETPGEVIVCDDQSTDATPHIIERLQHTHDRLKRIEGQELPPGWIGKVYACHQLAASAQGDILFFIDADTKLSQQGLSRVLSIFDDMDADVVSAVPRQETHTWFERLILPLLHLTYTSWLPMALVYKSSDPRFLAANGQLMAMRRDALERIGGFESIRDEMVDDMALGRRFKKAGLTFVFADGHHMATCRMYKDAQGVWEGFSKNLYEGIGHHPLKLAGIMALYAATFVAPYGLVAYAHLSGREDEATGAHMALGMNLALRALLALRHKQPIEGVLTHPIGVLSLLGIALNSARVYHGEQQTWRGRQYLSKHARAQEIAWQGESAHIQQGGQVHQLESSP